MPAKINSHSFTPALSMSEDRAIRQVLDHRFGDRSVYLCNPRERRFFEHAQILGLISTDGQITAAGLRFANSHHK